MNEPTTIHWLTLPRNGNGGAALVTWRQSTQDSMVDYWHKRISYLLGGWPPRYPVPAIKYNPIEYPWLFAFVNGKAYWYSSQLPCH